MRLFIGFIVAAVVVLNAGGLRGLHAETFRMALPTGTQDLYKYQVGALQLALDHAPGDHRLEVAYIDLLTQGRLMDMLRQGEINITLSGYNRSWEQEFLQVDFPLTRGLQGYRLLIIPPGLQSKLSDIQNLEDIKSYCIGSGANWQETPILKRAGLCVEEAPQNALFNMLEKRRFDMMHLAVHEALLSEKTPMIAGRDLVLEQELMLRYKYDLFYYVRQPDQARHEIVEKGFQTAFDNGAFMEYFRSSPEMSAAMDHIRSSNRRIIDIENVDLSQRTRKNADMFWFGD